MLLPLLLHLLLASSTTTAHSNPFRVTTGHATTGHDNHLHPTSNPIPSVEIAPNVFLPMLTMGGVVQKGYPDNTNYSLWLDLGGRGFDSAWEYGTQTAIAEAIKASGVPRADIFITTKIPGSIHNGCCGCPNAKSEAQGCAHCHGVPGPTTCFPTAGYYTPDMAKNFITKDLELLAAAGVDYIDMLLMHEPADYLAPYPYNASKETSGVFGAMEEAFYSTDPIFAGKIKAIGVSNFDTDMLTQLATTNPKTTPVVNQCRMTVGAYDKATHDYCVQHGITYQGYSTLHGNGATLPAVVAAAAAHNVSVQSVEMRWVTQLGIPIVTASNVTRYDEEDLALFKYNLTAQEMVAISQATPPAHAGTCQDPNPTCTNVGKQCITHGCQVCSKVRPSKSCGSCGCQTCCDGCTLRNSKGLTYCANAGESGDQHVNEAAEQWWLQKK